MSAQPADYRPLCALTRAAGLDHRALIDAEQRFPLGSLDRASLLGPALPTLKDACVLIWSQRQLPAARALLELDGLARSILLCPPDLAPEHLPAVIAEAEVDAIVADATLAPLPPTIRHIKLAESQAVPVGRSLPTEWVLFTSGTTGRPKLVAHSLASLTGPLVEGPVAVNDAMWSTFYDIRRYGGLQILLRALLGGGSLILSQAGEPVGDFLRRAGEAGVTHMLGTPTHWRRALMSQALDRIAPRYVRLSGEIADQAVLDQLARAFPAAGLTHAYASTEAGVGFEVHDKREGFPATILGPQPGGREIRIVDGSIRMRSPRAAARYLGDDRLAEPDGFIDTGDMVVAVGDRFHFAGRRSGVINVGGQKVHPEEVEAVIMRDEAVRIAQVRGRSSPITGTLVVADIVLLPDAGDTTDIKARIMAACRAALPPHKVPAMLHEVSDLAVAASGKLERRRA